MSRRLAQLTEIIWLIAAIGCTTAENNLGAPPGSAGGSSSGGGGTAGQSSSTNGGTAGNAATGGAHAGTGGAPLISTGGTVTSLGGGAATGGSTSSNAAVTVIMTLTSLSADTLQGVLGITLPAGAAPIPMLTLKLTLCGAGSGGLAQASAMQIYDGRLNCPQPPNPVPPDCSGGSSNSFMSSVNVTVSGTGPNCCFNFDFSSVSGSLGVGGSITLNYAQIAANGNTLNHTYPQVWTALVNGMAAAGICTIPPSPAASATCG